MSSLFPCILCLLQNTGRDKRCSGHGQCGVSLCSCELDWYDIMCTTFCNNDGTCSGHGRCNPGSGKECVCDEGWGSITTQYPGPFCTQAGAIPPPPPAAPVRENPSTLQILMVVLPTAGGVLLVGLGQSFCVHVRVRVRVRVCRHDFVIAPPPGRNLSSSR